MQRCLVQLFRSSNDYVNVFCGYVLFAFSEIYVLAFPDVAFLGVNHDSRLSTYLNFVITVVLAVYLALAWRKTSNSIERTVIALTGADCIVGLTRMLYVFRVPWAGIPYERIISAALFCIAAALAGIRTFEVRRLEKA
jgi:hypothetical protein